MESMLRRRGREERRRRKRPRHVPEGQDEVHNVPGVSGEDDELGGLGRADHGPEVPEEILDKDILAAASRKDEDSSRNHSIGIARSECQIKNLSLSV